MNNKGQTLVIFIILLPILLILCSFVIDMGLLTYESVKLKNTTKTILESINDSDDINEKRIKELYKKNNIDIDTMEINISADKIVLKHHYQIDSIFGKIIKINHYEVKIYAVYDRNEKEIKYIKE